MQQIVEMNTEIKLHLIEQINCFNDTQNSHCFENLP